MLLSIVWNPLQVLDLILINSDLIELKRDENDIVWKVIHFSLTSLSPPEWIECMNGIQLNKLP